jgi:C4-dicarboxylate-specific signal transduction histidine kinase
MSVSSVNLFYAQLKVIAAYIVVLVLLSVPQFKRESVASKSTARIKRQTARKKLLAKVQLIKDWIKKKRHLPKHEFFATLKPKLVGH